MDSNYLYKAQDVSTGQWVYGNYVDRVTGCVPLIVTDAAMQDNGKVDFNYHFVRRDTVERVSSAKDGTLKHAYGDVFDSNADAILHQVNCRGVMGAGIAMQVRVKFPRAYQNYKWLCKKYKGRTAELLGSIQVFTDSDTDTNIINLFAQDGYGSDGTRYTNYDALRKCLERVNEAYAGKTVAIPYLMGCNRGGGDWNVVSKIIEESLKDCDVTIYHLRK